MSRGLTSAELRDDEDGLFSVKPRDLSAWGVSLGVHLVVLFLLSFIYFEVDRKVTTLLDSAFEDVDADQLAFDATAYDQAATSSSFSSGPAGGAAASAMAVSQAAATSVSKNASEEINSKVDETLSVGAPTSSGELVSLATTEMLTSVQTTGGTEQVGSVEGALDRMAFEIANSLREKKTLVIWLFDVSASLGPRREKIAERVENIYGQLNQLNVNADKALKTAVAVFGEKTSIVTADPLDDGADVVKAIREIKSQDTGKENVFNAVGTVVNKFLSYRTKQNRAVMVVVVTDEAGSDVDKLEDAIQLTKRYGIKVHVIGEGAPLGRKKVEVDFKLENGETVIGEMDRGPESFYQQRLRLGYWGVGGYDLENIPSGFGPYGLTRLCAETNGLFLMNQPESRVKLDPLVMRSYPPDYRPIPMIDKDITTNLAKRALVEVCNQYQVDNIPLPNTTFPAENDNVLRTAITEAQRPLAELEYRLDGILQKLEAGEKDRAKIQEPRWRATYDLAMGRVLAMRVRSYGYNMMLAEMKSSPKKFEKQGSNQWRLLPSKDITSGAVTKKMAKKAEDYLKRVIDEHSGTPWAVLAEREYSTPLGWEWKENNYTPPPANAMNGKNKAGPRFAEEIDPKTGKKVKKMIPDGPKRQEI